MLNWQYIKLSIKWVSTISGFLRMVIELCFWSQSCISDVFALFVGNRDSNISTASCREWATREPQQIFPLYLGSSKFRMVADIHCWHIGNLKRQKQARRAHCHMMKISINTASAVIGFAYCEIKASCRYSSTQWNYCLPWLVKIQYIK